MAVSSKNDTFAVRRSVTINHWGALAESTLQCNIAKGKILRSSEGWIAIYQYAQLSEDLAIRLICSELIRRYLWNILLSMRLCMNRYNENYNISAVRSGSVIHSP